MRIVLYRATSNTQSYASGACFAADEEDAEAYLDNQGYGGEELIEVEISASREDVLSLVDGRRNGVPYGQQARDAWQMLADALGEEDVRALRDDAQNVIHEAVDRPSTRKRLSRAGYSWVVYEDTFPRQGVTWQYLGEKVMLDLRES